MRPILAAFAVFTAFAGSGDWTISWKPEVSASVTADGLELLASKSGAQPISLGVVTLVHPEMIALSPSGDMLAVTAGLWRETWTNKSIALIDLRGPEPSIQYLTGRDESALLPAWSPDGSRLAWCAGPDADAAYRQRLISEGQTTVKVVAPNGAMRQAPLASASAPIDFARLCLRARRIWIAEAAGRGAKKQLTDDPEYQDEAPHWSEDGRTILFGRIDSHDARTIWSIRPDGSGLHQTAGPFPPAQSFYGYTAWSALFR